MVITVIVVCIGIVLIGGLCLALFSGKTKEDQNIDDMAQEKFLHDYEEKRKKKR